MLNTGNAGGWVQRIFAPKARTILIGAVFNKMDVYSKMEKDERRKEELLEKSGKYLQRAGSIRPAADYRRRGKI
jgi:hypothetical protein